MELKHDESDLTPLVLPALLLLANVSAVFGFWALAKAIRHGKI